MAGLSTLFFRHPKLVVIFLVFSLVIGGATSGKTSDRLTFDFSLPGQAGYETSKKIAKDYGSESQGVPFLLVLYGPAGTKVNDADAATVFAAVQKDVPTARIVDKSL